MQKLTTVQQLRDILGEPSDVTFKKIHASLSPQALSFIQRSPFLILSTQTTDGQVTSSPKGDAAGFVYAADGKTLYLPERKGNRLIFSLQNILATGRVGLIFLVPNMSETLRISGRCELVVDEALCQQLADRNGNPAQLLLKITVEENYFHCAKAFYRSGMWQPDTWADPDKISFAEEMQQDAELDARIDDSYRVAMQEEGVQH